MDKKPHVKPYLYGMLAGFGAISLSIIFFFLIYRFDGFGDAISTLTGILMPFIYGAVIAYLLKQGHEVFDEGAYDTASVDYPDIAIPVCEMVAKGEADRGVLLCGTGIGMSIAANKVRGSRCTGRSGCPSLCWP